MPPGVGYKGKTGPTKKTRTVARIAAAKGISRPAANKIRKKRKTNALVRGKSGKSKNPAALKAIGKEKIRGSKRVKHTKVKMVKDTAAWKAATKKRAARAKTAKPRTEADPMPTFTREKR